MALTFSQKYGIALTIVAVIQTPMIYFGAPYAIRSIRSDLKDSFYAEKLNDLEPRVAKAAEARETDWSDVLKPSTIQAVKLPAMPTTEAGFMPPKKKMTW